MAQENIKIKLSNGVEAEMLPHMTHGISRKMNATLLAGRELKADIDATEITVMADQALNTNDVLVLGLLVKLGDKVRPNITQDDIDELDEADFNTLLLKAQEIQKGVGTPSPKQ